MKIAIHRLTSNEQQLPSPKSKLARYLLKVNDFKMQVLKAYENCKEPNLQKTNSNFLHLLLIPSCLEFLVKFQYNIRTLPTYSCFLTTLFILIIA
mgnify:CR=1 FL=1